MHNEGVGWGGYFWKTSWYNNITWTCQILSQSQGHPPEQIYRKPQGPPPPKQAYMNFDIFLNYEFN